MSKVLIILAGRKRTGKESVYKIIDSIFPGRCQEFQFATQLKNFCIQVLGLTHGQCYGTDAERESQTQYKWGDGFDLSLDLCKKYNKKVGTPMTAREILQIVGTDLIRSGLNKDVWAGAGVREAANSDAEICIFDDVRFLNEIDAANNWCPGIFSKQINIRLIRETGLTDSHSSETELDHLDPHPSCRRLPESIDGYKPLVYTGAGGCSLFGAIKNQKFNYLLENNKDLESLRVCTQSLLSRELPEYLQT